jgi:hypothetical protein
MDRIKVANELVKMARDLAGAGDNFDYKGHTIEFRQGFLSKPWFIVSGPSLKGKKEIGFKKKKDAERYIDSP